ncbi:uncharacterized protein [Diabrotica undecimpunctata]|uniref:uncharacterized protein n=1 Tax=Diabrotica undecimpunctata TaxID=50387 RepID=UPI003B63853E
MDIRFVLGFSVQEALNMVYEDDVKVRNIYVEPPNIGDLTDEDSGEEDGGGFIDNLSRKQLEANVEVQMYGEEADKEDGDIEEDAVQAMDISQESSGSFIPQTTSQVKKIEYESLNWITGDLVDNAASFPEYSYEPFNTLTPVEMFELFFDEDIISYILNQCTSYALQKNFPDPKISAGEMRCFFAILILSGYNWLPGKKFYWDTKGDMESKANMQKRKRGDVESILERETGIIVVRWLDNSVVSVASTCYGVEPQSLVKRYSQAEKKIIQVQSPCLIGKYNNAMGGTDLMDENINRFKIGMRAKKWYWSLITWMLDATIQNAWVLHKKSGNKLTQLEFRREIVQAYLTKYGVPAKQGGRPSSSLSSRSFHRVSDDIRYDGVGHLLEPVPNKKKIRCAGEECRSIMRTRCTKCEVGLYTKCNVKFHTQL